MVKEIAKLLIVGSGCSSVAIVSTTFSSIDDGSDTLIKHSNDRGRKITEIKSYGEIEAYGQQNGCVFRIIDETEDNKKQEYSLADFWSKKKDTISNLETEVVRLANLAKWHCGPHASSVMAISYVNRQNKLGAQEKIFMLKRDTNLITNKPVSPK